MRLKLLLVNPVVRYFDHPRHVPLGILQLLAILERDHPKVKFQLYDANAHRIDGPDGRMPGLERVLASEDWDVVAIGGLITAYNYINRAVWASKFLRPQTPIVAGGGFFSAIPWEMMELMPEIDYGCVGEAYRTFPELLKALDSGETPEHVDGSVYRKDGGIHFASPRQLIPEMDWLPFPAYDYAPLDIYFQHSGILMSEEAMKAKRRLDANFSLSCPFLCTFCWDLGITSNRSYTEVEGRIEVEPGRPGRKSVVRQHSPAYIGRYLEHLKRRYDVDFVAWMDENIVAHDAQTGFTWLKGIEEELDRRNLIPQCVREGVKHDPDRCGGVHHGGTSHSGLITKQMLTTLKRVGFTYLDYGLESFSAKILKNLGKGATPETNRRAMEMTLESGINPIPNQIIMFPEETWETLGEMLDAWRETGIVSMPFMATPYPGSQWFMEYREKILAQYGGDLEAFLSDLEDATKITALLTENFTPAEAAGIQAIMAQAAKTGDFANARRLMALSRRVHEHAEI